MPVFKKHIQLARPVKQYAMDYANALIEVDLPEDFSGNHEGSLARCIDASEIELRVPRPDWERDFLKEEHGTAFVYKVKDLHPADAKHFSQEIPKISLKVSEHIERSFPWLPGMAPKEPLPIYTVEVSPDRYKYAVDTAAVLQELYG